ncbi:MAG: TlpA disulfide reductase family protein [Bacteroidales bacterium]|nr:TlpA disulfide reductase family protein [Bacteroidales bacterium]
MRLRDIMIITALATLAAGCGPKGGFTLEGQLNGSSGDSLVLEEMTADGWQAVHTLVTDKEGRFNLEDTASNPRLLLIQTPGKEYITLLVMDGDDVNLTADRDNVRSTISVTGSQQTQLLKELDSETSLAMQQLDSIGRIYEEQEAKGDNPMLQQWITDEVGRIMDEQRTFVRSFIERHSSEPASLLALSHQLLQQPILDANNDFDLYERVDKELTARFPTSLLVKNLHEFVETIKPQIEAARKIEEMVGNGKPAPEISLPNPEGQEVTLSSFRGKYVLLDFWAGWCAPCRRENPNIVKAYNQFKNKGFEIYGVSLDRDRQEWLDAIKTDKLTWIHVSDLQFWNSPAAKQYGVQSIPANFLIDPNGIIIDRNLRGGALEARLQEIFQ